MALKRNRSIKSKKIKARAVPPRSLAKEHFFPKPKRKKTYDWKPNPEQQESPKKPLKSFSKAVATAVPQPSDKPTPSLKEVRRSRYARERLRNSNKDFKLNWRSTVCYWNSIRKDQKKDRDHTYVPIPKKKRPLLKAPPSSLLSGFKLP